MPLLNQPYIRDKRIGKPFPISDFVLQQGMLFGCHQDLTKKDLDYICKTIKEFDDRS